MIYRRDDTETIYNRVYDSYYADSSSQQYITLEKHWLKYVSASRTIVIKIKRCIFKPVCVLFMYCIMQLNCFIHTSVITQLQSIYSIFIKDFVCCCTAWLLRYFCYLKTIGGWNNEEILRVNLPVLKG